MDYNPLILGKNETQRVVCVEPENDKCVLFIEEESGTLHVKEVPHKYWLLSNEKLSKNFVKLTGNLFYKWGCQFTNREEYKAKYSQYRKMNKKVYCVYDDKESFLIKDGYTYFKGMQPKEVSCLSFDIESTGLYHNADSEVLLISNTFRKNGEVVRKLFAYDDYLDVGDMIDAWCAWVRRMDPSIMLGHNIYTFDLPYLQHVAEKYNTSLYLGRDGSALHFNKFASKKRIDGSRDQEYKRVRCYGRELIDTMFVAINYDIATKKYESYGLKSIIKHEKLEKEDRAFYDASQIRHNYKNPEEWKKIKAYCEHDADDALALYDLMIPATFYLTQSVPKPFQAMVESATGGQINSMMVRSYIQEGHSIPDASPPMPFKGAISIGDPGIYRNVHKVDVASLYPSIILECKVFDEDKDPKGNFLKITEIFTAERLKNKRLAKETGEKYYDDLQSSQKIVINSGYGFMGATGLNFNSPVAAEFITTTGREILQNAIDWATSKGFKIVNADTDSISYCKPNDEAFTEEERKSLLAELNSLFPEKIRFEDDGYYLTVIVLAAKNYILDDGKKVKLKGSSLKDAKKEPALKEFTREIIDCILKKNNNYQDIYIKYIKEAMNVKDIMRWATKKTISEKVLSSERTNETKIIAALEGEEYSEGDKIWVFFGEDDNLVLAKKFTGCYNRTRLVEKLFNATKVFSEVLPEGTFINYKLKRNTKALEKLLNGPNA